MELAARENHEGLAGERAELAARRAAHRGHAGDVGAAEQHARHLVRGRGKGRGKG